MQTVKMDLKRIFLTPPNTRKEKIGFFVIMLMLFVLFFAPICFSPMHPVRAILSSCAPALTTSWGWMAFTRFLFRKKDFSVSAEESPSDTGGA